LKDHGHTTPVNFLMSHIVTCLDSVTVGFPVQLYSKAGIWVFPRILRWRCTTQFIHRERFLGFSCT